MKKNILGIVILAIILSLCLSSVVFTAEVTELTMWQGSWWSEKAPLIEEAFEKAYPQYKFKDDCLPINSYNDNAITAILSGDPPDILDLATANLSSFADKNLLTDLTSELEAGLNMEDFEASALATARYKGKIYSMPNRTSATPMFYNKDMFDEAGIAYPKEGWTFDDFLDIAKKLTVPGEKYGYAFATSPSDPNDTTHTFAFLLWGFGGDYLNADNTKCTLDQPNAIKAITFLTELYTKYKVVPEGTVDFTVSRDGLPLFANNKLAMMCSHDGMIRTFADQYPDLRYGIVEPPNGGFCHQGGWHFTVPITAKHKKEAIDFLLWFAKPEVQAPLCARTPANVNARTTEPWNTPMYMQYYKAIKNSKATPAIARWNEALFIIIKEMQNALIEKKTPEQAAKDMTLQIDLLLK